MGVCVCCLWQFPSKPSTTFFAYSATEKEYVQKLSHNLPLALSEETNRPGWGRIAGT